MADWFPKELHLDTHIMTSEKGFTTDQIAVAFLKHLIKHIDAGPNTEWKLLLMDNHRSYETLEFIQLANENHILPYPLLAYLTHCMQPLDVGCFQPYKH
jgi:DDE superfamily endonuclease